MCQCPLPSLAHLCRLELSQLQPHLRVRLCEDASLADAHARGCDGSLRLTHRLGENTHPSVRVWERAIVALDREHLRRERALLPLLGRGFVGSCAVMSLSFSSVSWDTCASASVVRSASISRTAISPAAPPSTSPCVPLFPLVSAPRTPPTTALPHQRALRELGELLGIFGVAQDELAYCRSCLG